MKAWKRMIACLMFVMMTAFGCALTLKAAVGVGAWDALAQTGSTLTGIRVGTMGMILNLSCVFLQLILLKRRFRLLHALQIAVSVLIGYGVNFFYYDVLADLDVSSYAVRLLLLILGYGINSFTDAGLMLLDVVTFALEGACKVLAERIGVPFAAFRQGVDVVCVALCLAAALLSGVPLAVREGTVIGMIIFGPLLGMFMRRLQPLFRKSGLLPGKTVSGAAAKKVSPAAGAASI